VAVIDIVFAGGAVQTNAPGVMSPSSPGPGGTITVNDDTGYPLTGRFPIKLNRGFDDEEHVLIASRVGTIFTVEQRGYDGTNAQAHDNPTVEIYWDAETANLVVEHIDGIEADPHSTTLLNTARHDITARHTYGAALGTRPVPVSVGTANAAGSGSNPAAGDHVHDIAVGAIDAANLFAADVVNQAAIGPNAVGTSELINGNVTQDKLAPGVYIPIGGMIIWPDDSVSSNWLLANGQAVSRVTYAALFAEWGTRFGVGDGSTTFNVIDMRQRFPMGVAASGTGSTLAATGGTIDHVHSLDTATSHARITASTVAPHIRADRKTGLSSWDSNFEVNASSGAGAGATAQTSGASLAGNSGTANPPFIAVHFLIRAL
jgi:microcystin-dependent protein